MLVYPPVHCIRTVSPVERLMTGRCDHGFMRWAANEFVDITAACLFLLHLSTRVLLFSLQAARPSMRIVFTALEAPVVFHSNPRLSGILSRSASETSCERREDRERYCSRGFPWTYSAGTTLVGWLCVRSSCAEDSIFESRPYHLWTWQRDAYRRIPGKRPNN